MCSLTVPMSHANSNSSLPSTPFCDQLPLPLLYSSRDTSRCSCSSFTLLSHPQSAAMLPSPSVCDSRFPLSSYSCNGCTSNGVCSCHWERKVYRAIKTLSQVIQFLHNTKKLCFYFSLFLCWIHFQFLFDSE